MITAVEAEDFVDHFLSLGRPERLEFAKQLLVNSRMGRECFFQGHDHRIDGFRRERATAIAACQEVYRARHEMSAPGDAAVTTLAHRVGAALGTSLWP